MLSCRDVTELGSDIIDHRLGLRTRLAVMLHLRICPSCPRYIEQLKLTSDVLKALPMPAEEIELERLLRRLEKSPK